MNFATCFQDQMQFASNKKLEHWGLQQSAQSQSQGHPGCLVVHITVQLYMSSASRRKSEFVRINTDVLAYSMNECAVPEDIHTQHPFMASL